MLVSFDVQNHYWLMLSGKSVVNNNCFFYDFDFLQLEILPLHMSEQFTKVQDQNINKCMNIQLLFVNYDIYFEYILEHSFTWSKYIPNLPELLLQEILCDKILNMLKFLPFRFVSFRKFVRRE